MEMFVVLSTTTMCILQNTKHIQQMIATKVCAQSSFTVGVPQPKNECNTLVASKVLLAKYAHHQLR